MDGFNLILYENFTSVIFYLTIYLHFTISNFELNMYIFFFGLRVKISLKYYVYLESKALLKSF